MQATFIELPAFSRLRTSYLDDEAYRALQNELMENPLLKIYFQKGLMSKIIEHPDSELFASIFHPKINGFIASMKSL